jgi:hypothetical protein
VSEHCPTCGATVRVVSGDEGTSHYEPLGTVEALAKEVAPMAEQLRGAVDTVRAHRDRWYASNSKSPEEARPSDRELWRVVLGSDAAGGQ